MQDHWVGQVLHGPFYMLIYDTYQLLYPKTWKKHEGQTICRTFAIKTVIVNKQNITKSGFHPKTFIFTHHIYENTTLK